MDRKESSTIAIGSSCLIKARLIFSIIGVIIGFSAGAVFTTHFKNYNAGLWGFCSGVAALVALCVTVAYIRHVWDPYPHRLRWFMLAGCFVQLFGVCGFVAYLVLAISQQQKLDAYDQGFYIACVWCFMTWKWGFLLLIYSRSYYRVHQLLGGAQSISSGFEGPNPYKTLDENGA